MHFTDKGIAFMHLRVQNQNVFGIVIRQQTGNFGRRAQISLLGFINHQSHQTFNEVLTVCRCFGKINPANTRYTNIKSQLNRLPINENEKRSPPLVTTFAVGLSTPVLFTNPAHNLPQFYAQRGEP